MPAVEFFWPVTPLVPLEGTIPFTAEELRARVAAGERPRPLELEGVGRAIGMIAIGLGAGVATFLVAGYYAIQSMDFSRQWYG